MAEMVSSGGEVIITSLLGFGETAGVEGNMEEPVEEPKSMFGPEKSYCAFEKRKVSKVVMMKDPIKNKRGVGKRGCVRGTGRVGTWLNKSLN